jgi:hypothetical protein
MLSDVEVETKLAQIRRWRKHVWLIWLGYLPIVVSIVMLLKSMGVDDSVAGPWVALPYMMLFAAAGIRVGQARCPRCGNRFHRRALWGNVWTRSCLHCRLPLRPSK